MGRAKRALKWLKKRLFGTKNHKKANTMTNPNKGKSSGSGWKNISDEDTDAWQLPDCLLPSESYTTIDIGESLYSTPSTIRRVYDEMPISPPHSVGSISSFSVLVMERHGNPEETGTAHASIKPFILITSPSGNVSFEVQMTCPSTVRLSHFSTKVSNKELEFLSCGIHGSYVHARYNFCHTHADDLTFHWKSGLQIGGKTEKCYSEAECPISHDQNPYCHATEEGRDSKGQEAGCRGV